MEWLKDPKAFRDRVRDTAGMGNFDNAEERRVILGSEAAVAGRKQEDVRTDHRGSYEPVGTAGERLDPRKTP